jgi:hypothetical protein
VDIGVLGPLEVRVDGQLAQLGGKQQAVLLARLAVDANYRS